MALRIAAFIFLASLALCTGCWIETVGYHLPGLTAFESKDRKHCLHLCLQDEGCEYVDYDTDRDIKCYIQKNPLAITLKFPKSSVTNYQLDRACFKKVAGSVELPCWTETKGHHIPGLTVNNKANPSDCRDECEHRSICTVIDWNNDVKKCFSQTENMEVSKGKLNVAAPVDNYILDRECLKKLFLD